jgi:hypothetical protein
MHHCKILNVVHVLRTRVELVYLQVLGCVWFHTEVVQLKTMASGLNHWYLKKASSHLTVGAWCLPADDPCCVWVYRYAPLLPSKGLNLFEQSITCTMKHYTQLPFCCYFHPFCLYHIIYFHSMDPYRITESTWIWK